MALRLRATHNCTPLQPNHIFPINLSNSHTKNTKNWLGYTPNSLVGELMWVRMRKFFFLASFLFSLLVKRISFEWIEKLTSWQQEKCCCLLAVVRVPCFRCIILRNNIVSNVRFCNYICEALLLPPEKILSSSLWFLISDSGIGMLNMDVFVVLISVFMSMLPGNFFNLHLIKFGEVCKHRDRERERKISL